jgi:AcrR family transcriptional regulator
VGIRQPSLFHHFPSKDAILQDLLSFDLDEAVPFAEAMAAARGEPSVRLYRYLRRDLVHLIGSPYNLSGLYTEEIMAQPAFAPWARKRDRLHRAIERVVREGVERGEFVQMSPQLVREAITGILIRTLTLFSGGRVEAGGEVPDQIASFVLRAILADPSELPGVRERARSLADPAEVRA